MKSRVEQMGMFFFIKKIVLFVAFLSREKRGGGGVI